MTSLVLSGSLSMARTSLSSRLARFSAKREIRLVCAARLARMNACARKGYLALLLIAAVCILPRFCPAQATPAVTRPPGPSRVDLFGGYSYLHPVNSDIYNQPYTVLNGGGIGSLTGYFRSEEHTSELQSLRHLV